MDEYPNSSETWAVEIPEDRKEVEAQEQAKVSTSIGVIQEVIDWFEANAKLFSTVDALGVDEATPAIDAKLAVLLSKKMKAVFESKALQFRADFKQYLKEVND